LFYSEVWLVCAPLSSCPAYLVFILVTTHEITHGGCYAKARAAGRRIAATAAAVCVGVGLGVELARAACDCGRRVDSHLAEGHGQKACGAHGTESHESSERLFVVVAQKPQGRFEGRFEHGQQDGEDARGRFWKTGPTRVVAYTQGWFATWATGAARGWIAGRWGLSASHWVFARFR
jgi:hypothetical protein